MRIKKTLFSTELEITPEEIVQIITRTPSILSRWLIKWIINTFKAGK